MPSETEYYLTPIINGIEKRPLILSPLKESLIIGRDDECDIVLDIKSASRNHARLIYEDGSFYIEDLNSTHGTYLGPKKLVSGNKERLNSKDMIRFSIENAWYEYNCPEEQQNEEDSFDETNNPRLESPDSENQKKPSVKQQYLKLLAQYGSEKPPVGRQNDTDSENNEIDIFDQKVLRMLPGLNVQQIEKLDEYEKKMNQFEKTQKKYDELFFKKTGEEDQDDETQNNQTRKTSKKILDLKRKTEKLAKEIEELQDEITTSIFGEVQENENKIDLKAFYQEDATILDISNYQKNDESEVNDRELHQELVKMIKSRLFLEEDLRYEFDKAKTTQENGDDNDEYSAFMAHVSDKVGNEKKESLKNQIKSLNSKIQALYLRYQRLNLNMSEKLDTIENEIRKQVESVISNIRSKREKPNYSEVARINVNLRENINKGVYDDYEDWPLAKPLTSLGKLTQTPEPLAEIGTKRIKSEFISPIDEEDISINPEEEIPQPKDRFDKTLSTSNYFKDLGY